MPEHDDVSPDFTSLGDVAMTLLCCLLLFLGTQQMAIHMSAARSGAATQPPERPAATVRLDADGAIYWDGRRVAPAEFERHAQALVPNLIVRVTGTMPLNSATEPLAALQAAGARIIATNGD